ncbi:tetratricopeptide repeat protein [Colwellia sp. E2M01]|uniref:tetratricopeptide repeat protein n=1 Tax=Colwellia sp. E2M01 TaxID=2841561 RepID=UPI001C0933C9|nr:tetratricopeptide repeat protein [Colwellia sp. E2M01]MBU2872335.1 tetratricopeptide repeat protein [Colwellia sp. E2M01]
MNIKLYILIICLPLFSACQNYQTLVLAKTPHNQNLYLDNQFYSADVIAIENEQEIFALNDEMRHMVSTKLIRSLPAEEKSLILLEHLFNEENIALTYDGNANLTASQAYQKKRANCMSLTLMAYALAKAAGMKVKFREVDVPEYWIQNGQYNYIAGHVNLLIEDDNTPKSRTKNKTMYREAATQIDFDPFIAKKQFPEHTINKSRLLAMFYNNKGAEALVNNSTSRAYKYFKEATIADVTFSSAWGNLAILYKLSGHLDTAEYAYIKAINLQHNNLNALSNLALLLNEQSRFEEAQPIEEYIYKLRVVNPYYHASLGAKALLEKSYKKAVLYYKKALEIDGEQHEFYFGLAKAYYRQGELTLAKHAMKKAVGVTQVKKTKKQYIAKLNLINTY